jgi:Kef-type K+ transport system membrane component KefB
VALLALFVVVQSGTALNLGLSSAVLGGMVAILPLLFVAFVKVILPFAPRSEFGFLLILALLCAYLTRSLGVYYLVGAFAVGVTAVRLRQRLPELASERLLVGIELFASFFIPFYFFKAGLHLERADFIAKAIGLGLLFVIITVPIRIAIVAVLRHFALGERFKDGARVGLSLTPTLVFTLVLADILRERYGLPSYLFGALIVFSLLNTMIPGFILRKNVAGFEEPRLDLDRHPQPVTAVEIAPPPGEPPPSEPPPALPPAGEPPPPPTEP